MYRRILVTLDGSDRAELALTHATRMAAQFDSELVLLRVVVSPYSIAAPDMVLASYDSDHEALRAHAGEYLDRIVTRLAEEGYRVRSVTSEGPVAEVILDHAEALDVDLIVMSTHGRGGVSRWVYGSVADRVLQGASCPVLLVRVGNTS
ncbi:MAG: universal stress protein [Chloroflexota bacterium]|nr:universal stress protein [Chloroflexota bacterium]